MSTSAIPPQEGIITERIQVEYPGYASRTWRLVPFLY
jgi:hypothetical protein